MNHKSFKIEVCRGHNVESEHEVLACVTNAKGEVLQAFGDVTRSFYIRSAAKPFQAVPFVQSKAYQNLKAKEEELALACSSHLGKDFHIQTAKNLLKRADLNFQSLQNHAHPKNDEEFYHCLESNKNEIEILKQNCSGKHAGFLVTQKYLQEKLEDYLSPDSKLQKEVLKVYSTLSGCEQKKLTETIMPDGCGAPVVSLPLKNLAKMYSELGSGGNSEYGESLKTIYQAMANHPEFVRGAEDFNTQLIDAFSGNLVAKLGYEGVYGIALRDGTGIACKVLDGHLRALPPVILTILESFIPRQKESFMQLKSWFTPEIRNIHNLKIGEIRLKTSFS